MAKHFKTILAAVVSMIALASCEQEIADFTNRLDDLESRVSKLEELCAEMNSNISSLQAIVTAMQSGDYITSVNPITSDGMTVGYTITFAKGDPITIYHGQDGADGQDGKDGVNGQDGQNGADGHTPVIGVKQDTDGIWYWTIDGEWLLDSNNQKVKAVGVDGKDGADGIDGQNGADGKDGADGIDGQNGADGKDGITPQLKIEDGYWFVSVDNGTTWTQMGKATGENGKDGADGKDGKDGVDGKDGDSMFQSVTVTETEVTFVTSDGQTFVIKRASALSIEFDSADLVVMAANATRNIHYTITSGIEDITIEALSSADIKVKVVKNDAKTGALNVKTGAAIDEYSKVVVLVSNGSQAIMRTLNFEEEAIEVEENTTKEVTDAGGEVTLEFFSNTPCHAVIPEEAQSWISLAPATKAMEKQSIDLIIEPNIGLNRSAIINVVGEDDASNIVLSYTITQDVGGVWKEGTVPPDDEIWYTTKDNLIINYLGQSVYTAYDDIGLNGKPFDVNVIGHYFDGNRCVIKCDGPITKINNRCFSIDDPNQSTITAIMLPNSVEELGRYCFNMADITEFRTPDNLQICTCPFINNPRLTKFTGIHAADGHSIIINGVLCIYAPGSDDESYDIPYGVIEIGTGAFDGAKFRHVTIPNTVNIIGYDAFQRSNLESVTIPESVETIMHNAFDLCMNMTGIYGNPKFCTEDNYCFKLYNSLYGGDMINAFFGHELQHYTIPNGIVAIRGMAFYYGGQSLESVTIPESIKYIAAFAFKGCPKLQYLYGMNTTEDHRGYIRNGELQCLLSDGLTEYETTQDVRAIANILFEDNNTLEKIIIGDSVTTLGYDCFANCNSLRTIVLSCNINNFPFYCFKRSYNVEEIYIRSKVPPSVDDWTCPGSFFPEQEYDKLTIYVPEESLPFYLADTRWARLSGYLKGYNYQDLPETEFYMSSDYTTDGTTLTLQQSTAGTGIDLILMGDAFSDRQIADGTYAGVMQNAMNAFFSEEPYKSMKDRFNVYTVDVVSATEGYEHSGQALSSGFGGGTYVYGNDEKVAEYAEYAINEDQLDDALIIVMMNKDAYAGTCFMYYPTVSGDYGRGLSIAYFPVSSDSGTFNGLVSHEAGGHGFAKLGDEYAYEDYGAIPQGAIDQVRTWEPYGWYKNVDFTGNLAQVKWAQFIADERYAGENIGCYEGAYTYWTGAWRPTENSIMRYNTGGFNAPSRYAIWYRIGKLAYGEEWNGSYEDFVTYDAINRTPAAAAQREAQRRNFVKRPLQPLAPPVVIGHSWREGFGKE